MKMSYEKASTHRRKAILHITFHLFIISSVVLSAFIDAGMVSVVFFFLLFFLVVGQSFRIFLFKWTGGDKSFSFEQQILLDVLISSIITTIATIALSSWNRLSYLLPILGIVTIAFDLLTLVKPAQERTLHLKFDKSLIKSITPLVLLAAEGILVLMWRSRWLPWPESWGSDMIYHLFIVRTTMAKNGSSFLFSGYPRQFHTILAGISIGSGLDPYFLLYYGIFLIYPVAIILVYQLAKSLTDNRTISFLSAAFFPFVNDIGALLGPHYFYPSSYAFLIFLVAATAIRESNEKSSLVIAGLAACITLFFVYPYALFGIAPLLTYWTLESKKGLRYVKRLRNIAFLGATLVILVLIAAYYVPIYILNSEPLQLMFPKPFGFLSITPNLEHSIYLFLRAYSYLQILLLVLGLGFIIYRSVWTKKDFNLRQIALLAVLYIAVFFLPMNAAYRTEMYIRPLYILCIVYGAYAIALAGFWVIGKLSNIDEAGFHEAVLTFVVILILISASYPTAASIDNDLKWESHYPNEDEYAASEWLNRNCPKDGYILTDPATGFVMRSFILRNASTSMISGEVYYSLGVGSRLGQNIFSFFNSSSWNDTEYYEQIETYVGRIDYIVISPRTTDWLNRTREGGNSAGARYVQVLFPSNPAWGKFFHPRYSIVKQFGKLYILKKNDVTIYYEDNFTNTSSWHVGAGNPPYSNGQLGSYENAAHPHNWYHLYTNIPSFANTSDLVVQAKYRANITGVEGRVFGFSKNQMEGDDVFQTEYIYPTNNWSVRSWSLTDITFLPKEDLESISFGFHCKNASWRFTIDYIKIYGTVELQSPYKEEMFVHYSESFDNVSQWSVNAGGEPKSTNGIGYYENQAHSSNWYHMYTNAVSFENQTNLYIETRFRTNTTRVVGRIFGYSGDNRTGDTMFYTNYLPLGTTWSVQVYRIESATSYTPGPLESLSFGLFSSSSDWKFQVSDIRIIELKKTETNCTSAKMASMKGRTGGIDHASNESTPLDSPSGKGVLQHKILPSKDMTMHSVPVQFQNELRAFFRRATMGFHQQLLVRVSWNQAARPESYS